MNGSPDLPDALAVPLLAGRSLVAEDATARPRRALVTQSLARALWPGDNPLGQILTSAPPAPGADDRKHWTNPLRGSSPTERSPVVRAFPLLHPVIALPGYAPLHTPGWARRRCRGGRDDPASATHARGHAGSESLAAHATRLHRQRRPVRTALRAVAGGPGPRGDSHLPGLFDPRAAPGAQFARDRGLRAPVSLSRHAEAVLVR
jgi:hypothetical protein